MIQAGAIRKSAGKMASSLVVTEDGSAWEAAMTKNTRKKTKPPKTMMTRYRMPVILAGI